MGLPRPCWASLGFATELPEAYLGRRNWRASDPGQVVIGRRVEVVVVVGLVVLERSELLLATPTLRMPLKLPLQSLGLSGPPLSLLAAANLEPLPQVLLEWYLTFCHSRSQSPWNERCSRAAIDTASFWWATCKALGVGVSFCWLYMMPHGCSQVTPKARQFRRTVPVSCSAHPVQLL